MTVAQNPNKRNQPFRASDSFVLVSRVFSESHVIYSLISRFET